MRCVCYVCVCVCGGGGGGEGVGGGGLLVSRAHPCNFHAIIKAENNIFTINITCEVFKLLLTVVMLNSNYS